MATGSINKGVAGSRNLHIYVWRAEERFLFIATLGGAYDLVKEQPLAPGTLELIRREYEGLVRYARNRRANVASPQLHSVDYHRTNPIRELGSLVKRVVLHPDIRALLENQQYGEIVVSTNEFSIPWETVVTNGSYWALAHPVTRRLQSTRRVTPSRVFFRDRVRVVLVANPTGDLPGTENEARSITELFQKKGPRFEVVLLQREECERRTILSLLDTADIFHYAGHGYFDADRPRESGLVLHDGPLFASELENFLGATGPIVVFLNACESGVFGTADSVYAGQAMASIAHPFIACGCGAVICASLPVGDQQAAFFASALYTNLVAGADMADSAWNARRAVAREFGESDPTWGSFLCFGDGALRLTIIDAWSHADLRTAIREAAAWIRNERSGSGHWGDRVYRTEAPMNCAEVVLALTAAGEELQREEVDVLAAQLTCASGLGYTAAPYEPQQLGIFTSCVAYVLQALLVLKDLGFLEPAIRALVSVECDKAIAELLVLQQSRGCWTWGAADEDDVGGYALFTVEALESLEAAQSRKVGNEPAITAAIERGQGYLRDIQRDDGGWGYRSGVDRSDPPSTCYVLAYLLKAGLAQAETRDRALGFLRRLLASVGIRDSDWTVDHRIVVPGKPQSAWPHFEDYGGLAGLANVLVLMRGHEEALGTSGLLHVVVERLLSERDCGSGWPRAYPTIYATNYVISVLADVVRHLKESLM